MTAVLTILVVILGVLSLYLVLSRRVPPRAAQPLQIAPASAPVDGAESLQAAVQAERERIYSDLHDDLGAKLLELVYRAESPESAALARSALQDLRDVVSKTRGQAASLLESLSEIELESRQRLALAEIELHWQQDADLRERRLDGATHLQLFRIMREAITNVIRHAHAEVLKVRVAEVSEILRIEIKDDGQGMHHADGRGKSSMRKRAEELSGHITWRGGTEGGTRVLLSVPLKVGALTSGVR